MKFITLVDNFKKSINLAEKITGKNLTLPILSNILLKTNKNKLHLLATDLEIGIELIISGKVEKEGKFIIPAKTFSMFLNNLSEEKITIEESKNVLLVKSGNYNTTFQGINPDEFPIIPETKTEKYIEIEKKEMIIPLRTAQEVLRIIQEEIEEVSSVIKISPESNQVQFSLNNVRLISRLINAEYPKYSSIIPSNFENQTILNKKKLIEAVKIVGLFSGRINDAILP